MEDKLGNKLGLYVSFRDNNTNNDEQQLPLLMYRTLETLEMSISSFLKEKRKNDDAWQTPAGLECMATMDDITEDGGNYCEFQTSPSGSWHAALFCSDVVEQLLATQFHTYMKKVQEADCKAELRRLVAKGPPVWLEDKHALPLPEGDTHIISVWFAKDDEERSAKLDGAVEGEARETLWKELQQLLAAMEEDKEEVR